MNRRIIDGERYLHADYVRQMIQDQIDIHEDFLQYMKKYEDKNWLGNRRSIIYELEKMKDILIGHEDKN